MADQPPTQEDLAFQLTRLPSLKRAILGRDKRVDELEGIIGITPEIVRARYELSAAYYALKMLDAEARAAIQRANADGVEIDWREDTEGLGSLAVIIVVAIVALGVALILTHYLSYGIWHPWWVDGQVHLKEADSRIRIAEERAGLPPAPLPPPTLGQTVSTVSTSLVTLAAIAAGLYLVSKWKG